MDDLMTAVGMGGRSTPSSTQPSKDELMELITSYQDEHDSEVMFIDHFEKSVSVFGSYLYGSTTSLDKNDAINFLSKLRGIPSDKDLDIIIHTNGGSLFAAETIINAIFSRKGKVRIHIPYYACSAGTLIALAADEIIMHEHAYIGPIDPQYTMGISATSISKFDASSSTSWVGDVVQLMKSDSDRSITRVKGLVSKICSSRAIHDNEDDHLCDELASGKYNHDQPIFYRDIQEKKLLKNISIDIDKDIIKIFEMRKLKHIK